MQGEARPTLTFAGTARPWGKVLVVITEDWFALSHFVPLLSELRTLAGTVVVATRPSGRFGDVHALGVETRAFDMQRGSLIGPPPFTPTMTPPRAPAPGP